MRRSGHCIGYTAFALLVVGLALPALAHAEDGTLSAREHFARGYSYAESGDANAAIHEFELAYAASPNPSVLYNLGQAYAAVGRSSEAIDALERYLKLSGSSLTEARAHQVDAIISYHAQRVGKLELEVEPTTTELVIDGLTLGRGQRVLPLNVGAHSVVASAAGFESASVRVEISARNTSRLKLHLEPRAEPAQIAIKCALSEVSVFVDAVRRGQTPLFAGSPLPSGTHRVRFERPGYRPDEHSVRLVPGAIETVPCRLEIDASSPSLGRLAVKHPEGTRVLLDNAPFRGSPVPHGRHRLSIGGAGYASETRQIELKPGEQQTLTLLPSLDARELDAARARTRQQFRIWAYVSAGVGIASAGTALAIYLDNNSRYSAWQAKSRRSVSNIARDPNAGQALDQLLSEENALHRRDSVALGLAVFSCAALATSAVLFLSSRETEPRLIITAGAEPGLRYEQVF